MKYQLDAYEDLPKVLNASELAHMLNISRAGAYNLMNSQDFPTLRIGGRKLVPKNHLLAWMDAQVKTRTDGYAR